MSVRFDLGIKGLALGLVLGVSTLATAPAQAQGFGEAFRHSDMHALPLVEVQARRAPQRRVVRRNNNGAVIAGALVGAAIVGGAIIANSEARREQRRREQYYYYGAPPTYYDGGPVYVDPRVRHRRAVQPTRYYYEEPRRRAYDPRYRYPDQGYVDRRTREWTWDKNEWDARRQYYRGGETRNGVIATPDRETPYTYAPSTRYDGGYASQRLRRGYDPGPRN
jgi:hypothetical protein